MTVNEAITRVQELTGQTISNDTLLGWLSELDGQIATDFYKVETWLPYDEDDITAGTELLLPFPWAERVYVQHLEAMTHYANGEYDRYENARTVSEAAVWDFRRYLQRTTLPAWVTIRGGGR